MPMIAEYDTETNPMPPTPTALKTFRQLVAEVAARAKERLPEAVNGRVEAAVKLVLSHDVTPQDDGSILVGSSSDPLKEYRLEGHTCTCQDFSRGQAPDGWCQHLIAAAISKRVEGLMQTVATPAPEAPAPPAVPAAAVEAPLPEAPASCNVYVTISGHKVQVTLRDHDEHRMLGRLQAVLDQYPVPQAAAPVHHGEGWCHKHNVQMTQTSKEGRSWWSHKTADGWCKGK